MNDRKMTGEEQDLIKSLMEILGKTSELSLKEIKEKAISIIDRIPDPNMLNVRDESGDTPLLRAIDLFQRPALGNEQKENLEIIRSMLKAGANPNIPHLNHVGREEETPLDAVCEVEGDSDVVKELLEAKADPNYSYHRGSPLKQAIRSNDYKKVLTLLEYKALPSVSDVPNIVSMVNTAISISRKSSTNVSLNYDDHEGLKVLKSLINKDLIKELDSKEGELETVTEVEVLNTLLNAGLNTKDRTNVFLNLGVSWNPSTSVVRKLIEQGVPIVDLEQNRLEKTRFTSASKRFKRFCDYVMSLKPSKDKTFLLINLINQTNIPKQQPPLLSEVEISEAITKLKEKLFEESPLHKVKDFHKKYREAVTEGKVEEAKESLRDAYRVIREIPPPRTLDGESDDFAFVGEILIDLVQQANKRAQPNPIFTEILKNLGGYHEAMVKAFNFLRVADPDNPQRSASLRSALNAEDLYIPNNERLRIFLWKENDSDPTVGYDLGLVANQQELESLKQPKKFTFVIIREPLQLLQFDENGAQKQIKGSIDATTGVNELEVILKKVIHQFPESKVGEDKNIKKYLDSNILIKLDALIRENHGHLLKDFDFDHLTEEDTNKIRRNLKNPYHGLDNLRELTREKKISEYLKNELLVRTEDGLYSCKEGLMTIVNHVLEVGTLETMDKMKLRAEIIQYVGLEPSQLIKDDKMSGQIKEGLNNLKEENIILLSTFLASMPFELSNNVKVGPVKKEVKIESPQTPRDNPKFGS